MPKLTSAHPKLCRHRGSGQAYVDFGQGEIYLGPYGSKQARAEYDRLIAEWLANGRRPLTLQAQVTVAEVRVGCTLS